MNLTELYTDENSYFYNGDFIENGGFILGGSGYIIRGNSDLSNFESQYLGNGVNESLSACSFIKLPFNSSTVSIVDWIT